MHTLPSRPLPPLLEARRIAPAPTRTVIDPYGRDSTYRVVMNPAMGGRGQVSRRREPWPHCAPPFVPPTSAPMPPAPPPPPVVYLPPIPPPMPAPVYYPEAPVYYPEAVYYLDGYDAGLYAVVDPVTGYAVDPALAPRNAVRRRLRGAARAKTHPGVEFAVDDAAGDERIFKTFDEAAGFAIGLAASNGETIHLDVLVWSREGAAWWGGDDAEDQYDEDPEASVFERLEIRVNGLGRVA